MTPHARKFLLWSTSPHGRHFRALVSWWLGQPRDGFTSRAYQEVPRMLGSPFSDLADTRGGRGRHRDDMPRLEDL